MIALAIVSTLAALFVTAIVTGANGMRSSPGEFRGGGYVVALWCFAAAMWIGWGIG